jgi:hypothetical protein
MGPSKNEGIRENSEQLEAGDALDDNFRDMAADEIDRFRREKIESQSSR